MPGLISPIPSGHTVFINTWVQFTILLVQYYLNIRKLNHGRFPWRRWIHSANFLPCISRGDDLLFTVQCGSFLRKRDLFQKGKTSLHTRKFFRLEQNAIDEEDKSISGKIAFLLIVSMSVIDPGLDVRPPWSQLGRLIACKPNDFLTTALHYVMRQQW